MSSYQVLATQTPSTLLHGSHREFWLQATQNVQSQAVHISDATAGDSRGLLGREEVATKMPEVKSHRRMRSQPQRCFSLLLTYNLESGLFRMYKARQPHMSDAAARNSTGLWEGE